MRMTTEEGGLVIMDRSRKTHATKIEKARKDKIARDLSVFDGEYVEQGSKRQHASRDCEAKQFLSGCGKYHVATAIPWLQVPGDVMIPFR